MASMALSIAPKAVMMITGTVGSSARIPAITSEAVAVLHAQIAQHDIRAPFRGGSPARAAVRARSTWYPASPSRSASSCTISGWSSTTRSRAPGQAALA